MCLPTPFSLTIEIVTHMYIYILCAHILHLVSMKVKHQSKEFILATLYLYIIVYFDIQGTVITCTQINTLDTIYTVNDKH